MVKSYQDAVKLLNSLQTNSAVLDKIRQSGNLLNQNSLPEFKTYIERCGYKTSNFNQLNAIHVAGTKGKGSTCSLCESILRHSSLKTGLYTSPHLVQVRERIRINGKPLSEDLFAKYFFEVWTRLESNQGPAELPQKPSYFRYLTLMALHTFVREQVDVAVIEVGIGGEYDATNILEQPIVCGITTLGMDHVALLGNTLTKIAWNKSGICKPNVPLISSWQPEEALKVIEDRTKERSTFCRFIPQISQFDHELGLAGKHQKINAALAMELCKEWFHQRQVGYDSSNLLKGLKAVKWPGRCQQVTIQQKKWFIDGAHTPESICCCSEWFNEECCDDATLIFNCTHGRDGHQLLEPLARLKRVKQVIFCTNQLYDDKMLLDFDNKNEPPNLAVQQELGRIWKEFSEIEPVICDTIQGAVDRVDQPNVLVTGSLHLVGGLLKVLDVPVE